eukprot:TRINITY_DN70711_c0_g1_i1.p1 TRINITY_DN70711_c0_g1~~TRINITY_DN70711_c0_g1_i1.p1  ORF type:complete len:193 (+),score=38.70 TRINITY_DN70711_c0_g1_i1:54-581(+)
MDCVRTSVREGAEKVHCVYRRGEADMPGSRKEVKSAKEEGVEFLFFNSPKSFVADDKGMITGMKLIQTELIPGKDGGRGRIIELDGSEQIMHADVIILALGFNNQKVEFLEKNGIELNDWGAIKVDENQQTTKEGVYAGGDTTRGADLVVTAALDGREAAYKILEKIFDEEIQSS